MKLKYVLVGSCLVLLLSWAYVGYLSPSTEDGERSAELVEVSQRCPAPPAKPDLDLGDILSRAEDLLHEAIDAFRRPPVIFDERELLYRLPPSGVPRFQTDTDGVT